MARKTDQPSRIPVRRWTTKELAHLVIPNPRTSPDEHAEFVNRYHEATGYAYAEQMPLGHAIRLITGAARTGLAWKLAKQYLTYGIPAYPQHDDKAMHKAVHNDETQLVAYQIADDEEADKFLHKCGLELTSYQFIEYLAKPLSRAKESMRAATSKRNLGENLGKTPAQRAKEQEKKALPENF